MFGNRGVDIAIQYKDNTVCIIEIKMYNKIIYIKNNCHKINLQVSEYMDELNCDLSIIIYFFSNNENLQYTSKLRKTNSQNKKQLP
ncbi:MAG: hypothetical protein LBT10_06365 [Methanobrevibacter sp.]|jgi:DNA integrity scanning protein DisA with diadenylate cyclase activity|nr:hypothetical protein [Methanobrevibacter sp.]